MAKTVEHSKENMISKVNIDASKWDNLATPESIDKTIENLKKHHINVVVVDTAEEALDAVRKQIPAGADVMNGSSTTLAEIGYVDFLKSGLHGWKNRHESILSEKDPQKQAEKRRLATTADYFVSSAQAVTETGDIVGCDASGSRVGAWLFGANYLIIVAGTNKIVPDVTAAMTRIQEFVFPLESARAQAVYGMGSNISKVAVLSFEFDPKRTTVILVKEKLGY
jgi:L-lactate utilization protein LutC